MASEAARREARGRVDASGALQGLLRQLLEDDPDADGRLSEVVAGVLDGVQRIVPCRVALVLVVDAPRAATVRQARGDGADRLIGTTVPIGRGAAGFAMAAAETVTVSDAATDHRVEAELDGVGGLELSNSLVVPLRTGGAVVGALQLVDGAAGPFSAGDRWVVEDLAPFVGLAVARLRSAKARIEDGARVLCRARLAGLEQIDTSQLRDLDLELVRGFDRLLLEHCRMLPIRRLGDGRLRVALADPGDLFALDDFRYATAHDVGEVAVAPSQAIQAVLERAFGPDVRGPREVQPAPPPPGPAAAAPSAEALAADVLTAATGAGVRVVWLDPGPDRGRVRVRSDLGVQIRREYPLALHEAVIRKITAERVGERLVLPDGRLARWRQRSTVAGPRGRIEPEPPAGELPTLENLGFSPESLVPYRDMISRRGRAVVHVGPRFSDRHVTALAAAAEVAGADAVTVLHARGALGLHGAVDLGAAKDPSGWWDDLELADPNDGLLVVGEVGSRDGAAAMLEAAATGALVLATMFAADSVTTLLLLRELGVPAARVGQCLAGVCAHRPVPRLCLACREPAPEPPPDGLGGTVRLVGASRSVGCESCRGTGRAGVVAAHELLRMSDDLRRELASADPERLAELAELGGMWSFADDLADKVNRGLVAFDAARRALGR